MVKRVVCLLGIALGLIAANDCQAQLPRLPAGTGQRKTLQVGELQRIYRVHTPEQDPERKLPLVLMLHGGGSNADVASLMGLTPLADEHGFVAVYPEAIDGHWNDGRDAERFREHDAQVDDVAFIAQLVQTLRAELKIDDNKIFVAGISNGGLMSNRLAMEKSDLLAAACMFAATLGEPLDQTFDPVHPVSVMFINGTDDPMVPYAGGEVKFALVPRLLATSGSRGKCVSTDAAVDLWRSRNKLLDVTATVDQLPDVDPDDGCTVERKIWTAGDASATVALIRVQGGGHSIPGGLQYLPKRIIGNTCRDFDGFQAMWRFFVEHPRKALEPVEGEVVSPL